MLLTLLGTPWILEAAYADDHRQQKPSASQQDSAARPAMKWATDDVVRQRMEAIRQAVAAQQADIREDRLESNNYQQLAEVINANVSHIIKDCKLTQAADAALHTVVLADLTRSSELMRTSPKRAAQRTGALGVLQSLRLYGEYFDHPGWMTALAQ
ncbi:hypothetical protein GCM10027343_11110 [Noviherbaspirillum agri]